MNNDFPRILTLLRKERGISQKQAAQDLGISQALLSHYEKGIRECGLDFIVRTADYYNVSCDYLLGKTPVFLKYEDQLMSCLMLLPGVLLVFGLIGSLVVLWKKKHGSQG